MYDADGIMRTIGTGHGMSEPFIGLNVLGSIKGNHGVFYENDKGRIFDSEGIAPCLRANDYKEAAKITVPLKSFAIAIKNVGKLDDNRHSQMNVMGVDGISCTIDTMHEPKKVAVRIEIPPEDLDVDSGFNQRCRVHSPNGISRTVMSSGHAGNEPKVAIPVDVTFIDKNRGGQYEK